MAVGKETEKGAGDEGRRSALALYEDIEAEHMAALEATAIAIDLNARDCFASCASGGLASAMEERVWPSAP